MLLNGGTSAGTADAFVMLPYLLPCLRANIQFVGAMLVCLFGEVVPVCDCCSLAQCCTVRDLRWHIGNSNRPSTTSHTVPYRTILYHTIPYHTIPYHTIPYHTIPYHTIPYHTIPYHTIPYHTIPCHALINTRLFVGALLCASRNEKTVGTEDITLLSHVTHYEAPDDATIPTPNPLFASVHCLCTALSKGFRHLSFFYEVFMRQCQPPRNNLAYTRSKNWIFEVVNVQTDACVRLPWLPWRVG